MSEKAATINKFKYSPLRRRCRKTISRLSKVYGFDEKEDDDDDDDDDDNKSADKKEDTNDNKSADKET